MKIIKSSFEILPQSEGLNGIYKQIEMAGRTCYKSEDKITETSAKEFAERMIKSGHGAMLEHGTIYLLLFIENTTGNCTNEHAIAQKYTDNKFSKCIWSDTRAYITTNYRVIIENNWLDDLQYFCEPTQFHEKRISVKFICDRGITHELVRHRVFSFAQESTRYCNYSKDKFRNELTFIEPCYLNKLCMDASLSNNPESGYSDMFTKKDYFDILQTLESSYIAAIVAGLKPQEARMILPNSLKSEIVMTGFESDWYHFFKLRTADTAHPQMRELAIPLAEKLIFCKNEI